MTVAKFIQPDMTTQDVANYKANIDGAIAVLKQLGAGFAPRAADVPNMTLTVDAGALFNRASGGFMTMSSQVSAAIAAPASDSKIVRFYILESGTLGKVEGTSAVSPVAPAYPAGCFPIASVTVDSSTTEITNAMITDERAFGTGYGVPKNTVLITASNSNWVPPINTKILRITASGAGAGAGGGASSAADATKYCGGPASSASCVIARLFNPEALSITVGSKGIGGASAATAGVAASPGTSGGATTITGLTSGLTFTCAGGLLGAAATAAANGAAGAAPAAGTGIAGNVGTANTANVKGGDGGGTGPSGSLSAGGPGAVLATTRSGSNGKLGSGGGSAIGFGAGKKGGDGGDGFVLVEIF